MEFVDTSGPGRPRRLTSLLPVVVSGGRGVVFFWEPTASHRKEISLHATTHTKQNNQQKKTLKKKKSTSNFLEQICTTVSQ